MVDDRKNLASGIPNPQWRKFQPFEPCSEVVVQIFETFVSLGGNIRATLRHLFKHGPHFPDFDDPDFPRLIPNGFTCDKPLRMKKRGAVYTLGSLALTNMMTNAVYLGHWLYKDHIVVWNSHPAIVPEDLFYRAFNYLSPYTLEGRPNPDYAPRLEREHSTKKKEHTPPTAIYTGLIGSYREGKWRGATVSWEKSIQTYSYECHYLDLADNQHLWWSRRCEYFDKALTNMLHAKLHATFDPEVWEQVLASAGEDFEAQRRLMRHQLTSIEQKMQALVGNFSFVQSQSLLQALEREYANYEQEKERLDTKLAELERRAERQDALIALAKQAEKVLANWDNMDVDAQRAVAQGFISRIIVEPIGKYSPVNAEICWRDNTSDTVQIAYRADGSTIWFPWEVEALTQMIDEQADQVTMAAVLPDRNWHAIRLKAYEIIGARNFHISPKPIRDEEKYEDYLARIERDGEKAANRTSGNRWRKDELEALERLLDEGAAQLEIAAALPVRTWESIRKKIVQLRGKGVIVPESGHLAPNERIHDYLERNPQTAGAMPFSILMNSSPQRRTKTPLHPLRAWGRAARASPPGSR